MDGGFAHVRNDDTIVGPTHLRNNILQIEREIVIRLKHIVVGRAQTAFDGHRHIFKLVGIEVRLVEIEVNPVAFDVGLVAQLVRVEFHIPIEILVFLQRLREKQSPLAPRLVDIEHHGLEDVFGINGQAAFHLGLAVNGLAIEDDGHLIVLILALQAIQLKLKEVVAQRSRHHGMVFAESVIKDFDGILKVNGRGEGNVQQVTHLIIGRANGLHRDEAEILPAHAEAELKFLVGRHIHEVGHLELAGVVLLLVDVVILETDGVLVNPNGLALQSGLEVESLGGDGFAVLHFQVGGILEAHHNRLARRNDTRSVAVEQGQQSLIQRLDAFNEHFRSFRRSLLAARGQETKQQCRDNQADATEFSQKMSFIHNDDV